MMVLSAMGTAAIIRLPDVNVGDQLQDDVDAHGNLFSNLLLSV